MNESTNGAAHGVAGIEEDMPGRRMSLRSRVALGAVAVVVVGSIVYAIAGTAGTTDSERPTGGKDSRIAFGINQSVIVQTADKAVVQVRVREVDATGFGFVVTVAGLPDGDTGAWSAILDDGTEVALAATALAESRVRVDLAAPLPADREVDEVRLDPDASAGDLYFEMP
jgi:hypothetical protein